MGTCSCPGGPGAGFTEAEAEETCPPRAHAPPRPKFPRHRCTHATPRHAHTMPRHATSCPTQVHKGRKSFLVGAVIHSVSDRPASAIHCGFFLTVMNGGGGQAVGARGVPGLPPSTPAFSTALRLPIMVAEVTGASVRIPHSPPSIPVCPPRPWPSVQTCPGWLLRAQVRSWPRLQRWETLLLQSLEGAGGLGLGSRPPRLLLIHRLWFGPRVGG